MTEMVFYADLLADIKARIRQAQARATLSANTEMILMYWDIGRIITERQRREGWGSGVLKRLAVDLKSELAEVKGFSERNLKRMTQFYKEYRGLKAIGPQAVAQLGTGMAEPAKGPQAVAQTSPPESVERLVTSIGWGHNILLIQTVKDLQTRLWYMRQTVENGWGRDTLASMIKGKAHQRQGKAVTNFDTHLPPLQSDLARQMLKDPYIFDFLTLSEPFQERELEVGLVRHLEKFLLELGQGFAFVGRQYHLEVSDKDFYLDLLFYHLRLRAFVVIDLKRGDFKPEYAGKMNFYCSVVDDKLKHETDQPTVGLIRCQTKDHILAEYALRDIHKPIGVSDYELTRALPESLKSSLPSIEEIEAALQSELGDEEH